MASSDSDTPVLLDLNNPVFQDNLFRLQKPERLAALDTLNKIRQLSWAQLYRDQASNGKRSSAPGFRPASTPSIHCASPSRAVPRRCGRAPACAC